MYKITATVIRPGGAPVSWLRMSAHKMTQKECEKLLFRPREAGKSFGDQIRVEDFSCVKVS